MSILLLAIPAVVLLAIILAALALNRRRLIDVPPSEALEHTAKHVFAFRSGGIAFGIVAGAITATSDLGLGRGPLLAVPVFAFVVLAGILLGEYTLVSASAAKRSALLEVRRWTDYVPRRLSRLVGATTAALLLLLTVTTMVGDADDMGRAGRSLATACGPNSFSSVGPWPGSYYSVPLLALLALSVLLTAVVVRKAVQRARVETQSGQREHDDLIRRRVVRISIAALGVLVSFPLVGISFFTATAINSLSRNCEAAPFLLGTPTVIVVALIGILACWTLGVSAVALTAGTRNDLHKDYRTT